MQDYPNLEVIGLNTGTRLAEAIEGSTGDYVVVLDPDVELTPDALSEAVREADGGEAGSAVRKIWHSVSRVVRRRSRRHPPLPQAEYFPSWAQAFDQGHEPQTITVARALSATRDNLVALDLDPDLDDMDREIAVRFAGGLRLTGPAARCSRVPDGIVAGRVGAVLTPEGGCLIESMGRFRELGPSSRSTITAVST